MTFAPPTIATPAAPTAPARRRWPWIAAVVVAGSLAFGIANRSDTPAKTPVATDFPLARFQSCRDTASVAASYASPHPDLIRTAVAACRDALAMTPDRPLTTSEANLISATWDEVHALEATLP